MQEITDILSKHDIAGMIVLHTPGFSEHLIKVDPTYSCARIVHDKNREGIRVRAKLQEDFQGNKNLQKKKIEDTINMFDHFSTIGGMQVMNILDTFDMLKKNVDFDSTPGDHTSNTQQNN